MRVARVAISGRPIWSWVEVDNITGRTESDWGPFMILFGTLRFLVRMLGISAALVILLGHLCSNADAVEKERKDPKFRWALGALHGTAPKVEPLRGTSVLKSGDKLKVMVELRRKCFVYLIHQNSQGELAMLFPYDLNQLDTDYQVGRRYYAPKGEAWFQLDNRTGRETFYLMASDQRLLDVEYLYNKYVAAEPAKRPDLALQLVAEMNGLKEQYRASPESPEVLALDKAAERGFERATGADPTDIAPLATDIWFDNIYSEIFVIEHR